MNNCGCNPWNGSVTTVCGEFETPLVEDQGQCSPRHIKIETGAPPIPVAQCDDDQFQVVSDPQNTENPFYIISRIFDECCGAITDEDGISILTTFDLIGGYTAGTCP